MTWQATLKPYKHQITHLGRVDIVISAENFFFCCENSGVKRGKTPTGGPRPTLPTPDKVRKAKKEYTKAPARPASPLPLPTYLPYLWDTKKRNHLIGEGGVLYQLE